MKKFIILSIVLCSILGVFAHFLYEFSGNNFIIGLLCPISESVFEHTKLVFTPITLIWTSFLFLNSEINKKKFFISQTICVLSSIFMVVSLYYTYTGALGISSIYFDITIFFLSVIFSHILAYHTYKYLKSTTLFLPCVIIYAILTLSIFFFTINPPNFPVFIES